MRTPLVEVHVASIYGDNPLPKRMAKATPDTERALSALVGDLRGLGNELRLSDLFRSYDMQKAAHDDYVSGRKKAYSPAPGGSLHEAGRAMDIDLDSIGMPLARFWDVARGRGFVPIIDTPVAGRSESWHFECRGSHAVVYEYVRSGRAGAHISAYEQTARSAILAIGERVDQIPDQRVGAIQAALIRLGFDPGRIDGVEGDRTRSAVLAAGIPAGADPWEPLGELLKLSFPDET
jgi:hypothetical protein